MKHRPCWVSPRFDPFCRQTDVPPLPPARSEVLARNLPLVVTMGGGYCRPIEASIDAHADVFRSATFRFARAPPAVVPATGGVP